MPIRVRQRQQADKRASTVLQYRKDSSAQHSTAQLSSAQHSTAQPARHKAAEQVRADQSATTGQRKQANGVSESQHMPSSIYTACLALKTKKSKSARPTISKYSHSAGVMRKGFAFSFDLSKIQHGSFSPRPLYVHRTCMRRPGCCRGAWSSWHSQVRKSSVAPTIVELSVRILFYASLRASVAGGGRRPLCEAPCNMPGICSLTAVDCNLNFRESSVRTSPQ